MNKTHATNSCVKTAKYATIEEQIEEAKAQLIKNIPILDLNVLSDRIQQMQNAPHLFDNGAPESE